MFSPSHHQTHYVPLTVFLHVFLTHLSVLRKWRLLWKKKYHSAQNTASTVCTTRQFINIIDSKKDTNFAKVFKQHDIQCHSFDFKCEDPSRSKPIIMECWYLLLKMPSLVMSFAFFKNLICSIVITEKYLHISQPKRCLVSLFKCHVSLLSTVALEIVAISVTIKFRGPCNDHKI